MRLLAFCAALALIFGCAPAQTGSISVGDGQPEPVPAATRRVAGTELIISLKDWQNSPWARISDTRIDVPVHLVIAEGGWACIVDGGDWAVVPYGSHYACESGWRRWRN
jgi:hypothetical protein